MNAASRDEVLTLWDDFVEQGYVFVDEDGDRQEYSQRRTQREGRLPPIRESIDSFLGSDIDLLQFRESTDVESKQHTEWGFGGMSQMFFNMLCNSATRQDRVGEATRELRAVLPAPKSKDEAGAAIRQLQDLVDDLKSNAENKRKAPQAGYIPAFLSFFWHISEPDRIPIYYQSSRSAYKKLGIWSPVDRLDAAYRTFWETTDEVRRLIEEERDESPHLWKTEFAVLNYDTRPHRPVENESSGNEGHQDASESPDSGVIETYADYESTGIALSDDFAVDVTGLYFPEIDELQQRIQTALQNGKHVLLVGPPGTGKTKLAKEICRSAVEDEFKTATATADWSTFDTIGGYQPDRGNDLVFKPGVFLDRFQDKEGQPQNQWLIVDEINRADIDKAFGSLFTALTGEDVVLPFTDENGNQIEVLGSKESQDREIASNLYYVPDGWRMLATMNTLDKTSLYEMSYAFMRRWAFVHVPIPDDLDGELVTAKKTRKRLEENRDLSRGDIGVVEMGRCFHEYSKHHGEVERAGETMTAKEVVDEIYGVIQDGSDIGEIDVFLDLLEEADPSYNDLNKLCRGTNATPEHMEDMRLYRMDDGFALGTWDDERRIAYIQNRVEDDDELTDLDKAQFLRYRWEHGKSVSGYLSEWDVTDDLRDLCEGLADATGDNTYRNILESRLSDY